MKRLLSIIIIAVSAGLATLSAQETDSVAPGIITTVEESGKITIYAPEGLAERLAPTTVPQSEDTQAPATSIQPTTRVGYRVLVFDDNNVTTAKHGAQARSQQLSNRFPEWQSYIQFNSPYWRVKVGDFKTRSEAEAAMAAIRAAFPSLGSQLRVVRDRINP